MLKKLKDVIFFISDYLMCVLFFLTSFFISYFFFVDTSYLAAIGVFENEMLLFVFSAAASFEITALLLSCFYISLRKKLYFCRMNYKNISFSFLSRYIKTECVRYLSALFCFLLFFSPFFLAVSSVFLLSRNGISEKVFAVLIIGCAALFFFSCLYYCIFIQRLTFLQFTFINHPHLPFKNIMKLANETSDGNLFKLLTLKLNNVFLLSSYIYKVYDFICEKENPYPRKVNTEKTIVFYFKNA